jgi:prolyl oligopeptidase
MKARTHRLILPGVSAGVMLCSCAKMTDSTLPQEPPASHDGDAGLLAWLNEGARRGAVQDVHHGVTVADPYRLLEEESPTTRAWLAGQTARTESRLQPVLTADQRQRIDQLMSIGVISDVSQGGQSLFYLRRRADQDQAALMTTALSGEVQPRLLVDPTTLGQRVSIDWFFPSPDGTIVAVGLSRNGDERSTLHLLELPEGRFREGERIAHCKWTTLSWLRDGSGFYYSRYPREGEDNFDAQQQDTYYPRVFFHRLGTDPAQDELVYASPEPHDFPSPSVSDDDRYVVINVMRGWSRSDVYLIDRQEPGRLRAVSEGREALSHGLVRHGRLYVLTNEDHPRYHLLAVAPEQAEDRAAWREIIAESEATIESVGATSEQLVIYEQRNYSAQLRLTSFDGEARGQLTLPTNGSIESWTMQPNSEGVAYVFSSFFYPPTLFAGPAVAGALPQVDQIETDVDVDRYVVTQQEVTSADGTAINVFLVHRRGLQQDGSNGVLLYGYGGFNISLLPSFSRRALYWLEQGGIYAVANLRGGGELGEEWHQAGQLENKHRVFEDFEAAVRWLGTTWSRPDKIAIVGGSNGGLLVGATLTRCPETFGAAVAYVGLYDMLRYHLFPPAELWISEYGSAEDPDQFQYLRDYSPYHNIRQGVTYPPSLIETADHDSRVFWGHSAKFAARLQQASLDASDILFYLDQAVGHGAGTGRRDLVEQTQRLYAFLTQALAP